MRAFQHFIRLGVGKSLHGDYRFARKHEQLSPRHETRLFKFFAIRRRHAALLQCIDLKHRRVLFSVRARGVCILFDVDPVQSRPISSVVAFSSLGRKDARIDDDRPRSRLDRRAARRKRETRTLHAHGFRDRGRGALTTRRGGGHVSSRERGCQVSRAPAWTASVATRARERTNDARAGERTRVRVSSLVSRRAILVDGVEASRCEAAGVRRRASSQINQSSVRFRSRSRLSVSRSRSRWFARTRRLR